MTIIDPWILTLLPKVSLGIVIFFCWIFLILEETVFKDDDTNNTFFFGYTLHWFNELINIIHDNVLNAVIDGSVYRSMVVSLTKHLPYFKELNTGIYFIMEILFGKNPFKSGYRVSNLIIKCILSYYLVMMDNIIKSIIFHIIFTLSTSIISFIYKKLFVKENPPPIMDISFNFNTTNISVGFTKLKRSNSCNDIRKPLSIFKLNNDNDNTTYKLVPMDSINKDILNSINKYDEIVKVKNDQQIRNELNNIKKKIF